MTTSFPPVKYIRYMSDLHLNKKGTWLPSELETDKESLLILAGDVGDSEGFGINDYIRFLSALEKRFPRILYVAGNHEHAGTTFGYFTVEMKTSLKNWFGDKVLLLDNEAVEIETVGKRLLVAGTTLWTDFSRQNPLVTMAAQRVIRDFHAIRGFSTFAVIRENQQARRFLQNTVDNMRLKGGDYLDSTNLVVVSHFSPCYLSGHADFKTSPLNGYYHNDIMEELMDWGDVKSQSLWIHGHTHHRADYRWDNWRITCNPLGYNHELGKNMFEEEYVIPVTDLYDGVREIVPFDLDES